MRLTTIGRRSGQERSVILGYIEDGPNLVTLAMNGWGEGEPAVVAEPPGAPAGPGPAHRRDPPGRGPRRDRTGAGPVVGPVAVSGQESRRLRPSIDTDGRGGPRTQSRTRLRRRGPPRRARYRRRPVRRPPGTTVQRLAQRCMISRGVSAPSAQARPGGGQPDCHRLRASRAAALARSGRVSTKVAPRLGPAEDAVTSPPYARAMLRAMVSPIPEPLERRGCPGAR